MEKVVEHYRLSKKRNILHTGLDKYLPVHCKIPDTDARRFTHIIHEFIRKRKSFFLRMQM